MSDKKLSPLPPSNDEYWEGEKYQHNPTPIAICATHGRDNWLEHKGYKTNNDGSISCMHCPWGTIIPGYMRVKEEKIVDLRNLSRR